MKNIIKIIALTFFFSVSCSKDFLEIEPTSTVTVDILYKTDKDYQDAVVGCYNVLQTIYTQFWMFGDLRGSDNQAGIVSNTPGDAFAIDEFFLNSDASIVQSAWLNYYKLIDRVNSILFRIETADVGIVKNKARHIAEAKFIRALAYFNLVRIFGDVPMATTNLTVEQSYNRGREKVDKIYDEIIIPDLLAAESSGLSAKYTGADVGRPTTGAVKSLLGKVYLTRKNYAAAETKLKEVTTMGYALLPNFLDLFDYTKNEHHTEYIFDIEYETGMNEGTVFTDLFSVNFQGGGAGIVAELNRRYGFAAGVGGCSGCPSQLLFDLFEPNDKRKDITATKGLYGPDGVWIPLSPTGIYSFSMKYMTKYFRPNDSQANWKVIRYADVLLMYAEVLNENNKTAEALTYLNMVRTRAGVAGYSGLTQADARQKILNERRRELYLEGHRWFDELRTGTALSDLGSIGMKDYMVLFPIPLSQILLINNPAVLPQNEGYN
jgi:hypothetical protein